MKFFNVKMFFLYQHWHDLWLLNTPVVSLNFIFYEVKPRSIIV